MSPVNVCLIDEQTKTDKCTVLVVSVRPKDPTISLEDEEWVTVRVDFETSLNLLVSLEFGCMDPNVFDEPGPDRVLRIH